MTMLVVNGLADAEVAQRVAEGKANDVPTRAARSSVGPSKNRFTRLPTLSCSTLPVKSCR